MANSEDLSPNAERLRISRDLHDGLAQEIAALGYQIDALIGRDEVTHVVRQELRSVRSQIAQLSIKARTEIYQLRKPSDLTPAGQLKIALTEITDLFHRTCIVQGQLVPALAPALQPIILELVRNFCAHESAPECSLVITPERIRLSPITAVDLNFQSDRFGLKGLIERLADISWELVTEEEAVVLRRRSLS